MFFLVAPACAGHITHRPPLIIRVGFYRGPLFDTVGVDALRAAHKESTVICIFNNFRNYMEQFIRWDVIAGGKWDGEQRRGLIPGGLKSNHKTNMIIEIKIEKAQLWGRVCQTWSAEVLLMGSGWGRGSRGTEEEK